MTLPRVGSRWRDIETGAESRVEGVSSGEMLGKPATMVTISYTKAGKFACSAKKGDVESVVVEMFVYFWREFVPPVWDRLIQEDDEV